MKQNDVAERVRQLMDVEVGFAQMVPPGMSIEAKEISREGKSGDNLIVQYHIFVKGAASLRRQPCEPPTSLARHGEHYQSSC
jgi:hypothetical protein